MVISLVSTSSQHPHSNLVTPRGQPAQAGQQVPSQMMFKQRLPAAPCLPPARPVPCTVLHRWSATSTMLGFPPSAHPRACRHSTAAVAAGHSPRCHPQQPVQSLVLCIWLTTMKRWTLPARLQKASARGCTAAHLPPNCVYCLIQPRLLCTTQRFKYYSPRALVQCHQSVPTRGRLCHTDTRRCVFVVLPHKHGFMCCTARRPSHAPGMPRTWIKCVPFPCCRACSSEGRRAL